MNCCRPSVLSRLRAACGAALVASTCVSVASFVPAAHAIPPVVFPDGTTSTADYANITPEPISAGNPSTTTSTIVVAGAPGVVWDVDVRTFITHTFSSDLDVTLSAPSGAIVTLTTDNGGTNDNVFNGTIWDDDANPGGTVPYVTNNGLAAEHVYANLVPATPLVPEEPLSSLMNSSPNGIWTLTVFDDQAGDGGTLDSWGITLTTVAPSPPTTEPYTDATSTTAPLIPTGPSIVTSTVAMVSPQTYICDLTVTTNISHTFSGDLDITLTSPAGTVVTLTTDNGGASDNVFNGTNWVDNADFDGQVPYAPGFNSNLVVEHVYAANAVVPILVPEESFGAFVGENPNGTWTLTVSDDQAGDGGVLISWSLHVKGCHDTTPPAFPTAPPNVTGVTAPGGATTIVTYPLPVATDDVGTPTVVCTPASGTAFPIGATTVNCTATNTVGLTAATSFTVAVTATPGPDYIPLSPARVADTRAGGTTVDGLFAGHGLRDAGSTLALPIGGRGGVPANASAVALNVTVTEASGAGFLTVFPCGSARPTASNLNYASGGTIPNAVVTKVGTNGAVCLYAQQALHLVVDVNGAFPPTTRYQAINPARVLDTRAGQTTIDGLQQATGAVGAGSVTTLSIAGRAGVPADAAAVVLNTTITEPGASGYATVYPCGKEPPTASNLNYTPGLTIPNLVVAKIGSGGAVCVFSQSSTHIIADVLGYFPATSGFVALDPARLLETRPGSPTIDGIAAGAGLRPSGTVTAVRVVGRGGVPVGASTAVLNVTVTEAGGAGFVTVYPCGIDPPLASNLNFISGQTIPNAVITQIGTNGDVCLFNSQPAQLIADVTGYFSP